MLDLLITALSARFTENPSVRRICEIENLLLKAANLKGMISTLTDDDEKHLAFWSDVDVEKLKRKLPQLSPFLTAAPEKEKTVSNKLLVSQQFVICCVLKAGRVK